MLLGLMREVQKKNLYDAFEVGSDKVEAVYCNTQTILSFSVTPPCLMWLPSRLCYGALS